MNNVSKACKIMGYHRDTFYEVKRAFQMGGVAGLVEQCVFRADLGTDSGVTWAPVPA